MTQPISINGLTLPKATRYCGVLEFIIPPTVISGSNISSFSLSSTCILFNVKHLVTGKRYSLPTTNDNTLVLQTIQFWGHDNATVLPSFSLDVCVPLLWSPKMLLIAIARSVFNTKILGVYKVPIGSHEYFTINNVQYMFIL